MAGRDVIVELGEPPSFGPNVRHTGRLGSFFLGESQLAKLAGAARTGADPTRRRPAQVKLRFLDQKNSVQGRGFFPLSNKEFWFQTVYIKSHKTALKYWRTYKKACQKVGFCYFYYYMKSLNFCCKLLHLHGIPIEFWNWMLGCKSGKSRQNWKLKNRLH